MAIDPQECVDRIRFSLSDKTGVLRVEDFEITKTPQCLDLAESLKASLVGRPVADIDIDYIRGLRCQGDGQCTRAIVEAIAEYHELFADAKD